jgi:CHAT domain
MFDERALIAQFESAQPDEVIHLLNRPSLDEEQALRAHLGDALYQRMHVLALRCRIQRERERLKGNVVIMPGFLGSELIMPGENGGPDDRLWLNLPRIMAGGLERLRLADDGLTGNHARDDFQPGGTVKRQYGELILSLARNWNVKEFNYDWRKDIEQIAGSLLARINNWFGVDAPVHIVAHGMGGLIARVFLKDQKARWKTMKPASSKLSGGRLLMLGTQNHGSYMALQAITGLSDLVLGLTMIDHHHDVSDLLKIFHSFVSLYQMLPSPLLDKRLEKLYQAETYGELHISRRHLDRARQTQERLSDAIDPERMIQVLGYGFRTVIGITSLDAVTQSSGYQVSAEGDGTVGLDTGLLRDSEGDPVDLTTYFLKEDHAGLVCSPMLLARIDELLQTGRCGGLESARPTHLDQLEAPPQDGPDQGPQPTGNHRSNRTRIAAHHLHTRGATSSLPRITEDERILSESLLRGLTVPVAMGPKRSNRNPASEVPKIELDVVYGRIASLDYDEFVSLNGSHPIDAIAVGHYVGGKPQGQELELDESISLALLDRLGAGKEHIDDSDLLLSQYYERGIIRGELGQPFFLDDPRAKNPGSRLIVVAGMGVPGRFGVPELSVLVRELVWSVGRLGKRHLAVAHIGTRSGTLSIEDSVAGWVKGIKVAFTGVDESKHLLVTKITFVASDPLKIPRYQDAILKEKVKVRDRLEIVYEKPSKEEMDVLRKEGERRELQALRELQKRRSTNPDSNSAAPTRVTLGLDRKTYRFGAIAEDASISERVVPIDPELVEQANRELAAESDPDMQLERGRFLERLVVPNELREMMTSGAPLVMMLDSAAARIHWEMVATTDPVQSIDSAQANRPAAGESFGTFELGSYFLGTSRGLTRQLRTTFAPPPEPPPPPRRVLRVLVVADPADDARLPGAEAEGVEIAELFESYNTVDSPAPTNHVEVVRLIGPREATRTNVLRELMIRSYDVLHFAGHCIYDKKEPDESGWLFSNGARVSAKELTRIDRVPKFIFSNACESGVTPDRSDQRSVALAPTFAESFFERGVSNFVCTAWPVDDTAARFFALNLYAQLLGLQRAEDGGDHYGSVSPVAMVTAMKEARLAIATVEGGIRTWGAYQHYGNPYFRFFAPPKPATGETNCQGPSRAKPEGQAMTRAPRRRCHACKT